MLKLHRKRRIKRWLLWGSLKNPLIHSAWTMTPLGCPSKTNDADIAVRSAKKPRVKNRIGTDMWSLTTKQLFKKIRTNVGICLNQNWKFIYENRFQQWGRPNMKNFNVKQHGSLAKYYKTDACIAPPSHSCTLGSRSEPSTQEKQAESKNWFIWAMKNTTFPSH